MIFDPFNDFATRGYLRNIEVKKTLKSSSALSIILF